MRSILIAVSIAVAMLAFSARAQTAPVNVDPSAKRGGDTAEVLVTNAAGGTTIPRFPGARAVELQNLGPNAIYCTVDGGAPLATGAHGRRVGPASEAPGNVWTLNAGPSIVITCIAATAAQLTTAATQVTQLR